MPDDPAVRPGVESEVIAHSADVRFTLYTLAPGGEIPWHFHSEVTDWFICREGTVTVDFATADGTATAGADYMGVFETLIFSDGQFIQTVTIPILDDGQGELAETIQLTLTSPTGGATVGAPGVATLGIRDDDPGAEASFVVTNTSDSGPGSFRQAILDANGNRGLDLISFDILCEILPDKVVFAD